MNSLKNHFLISVPHLKDPFFEKSVVYLCEHDKKGAMGLIINKTIKKNNITLKDSKSDIGWGSQIRSYVLDSSRIKDLRTGVETSNCNSVLDGDINLFIEASLKEGI